MLCPLDSSFWAHWGGNLCSLSWRQQLHFWGPGQQAPSALLSWAWGWQTGLLKLRSWPVLWIPVLSGTMVAVAALMTSEKPSNSFFPFLEGWCMFSAANSIGLSCRISEICLLSFLFFCFYLQSTQAALMVIGLNWSMTCICNLSIANNCPPTPLIFFLEHTLSFLQYG